MAARRKPRPPAPASAGPQTFAEKQAAKARELAESDKKKQS